MVDSCVTCVREAIVTRRGGSLLLKRNRFERVEVALKLDDQARPSQTHRSGAETRPPDLTACSTPRQTATQTALSAASQVTGLARSNEVDGSLFGRYMRPPQLKCSGNTQTKGSNRSENSRPKAVPAIDGARRGAVTGAVARALTRSPSTCERSELSEDEDSGSGTEPLVGPSTSLPPDQSLASHASPSGETPPAAPASSFSTHGASALSSL